MSNCNHIWKKTISGLIVCAICTTIFIEIVEAHEPQVHTHQEIHEVLHSNDQITTISGSATIDQVTLLAQGTQIQ